MNLKCNSCSWSTPVCRQIKMLLILSGDLTFLGARLYSLFRGTKVRTLVQTLLQHLTVVIRKVLQLLHLKVLCSDTIQRDLTEVSSGISAVCLGSQPWNPYVINFVERENNMVLWLSGLMDPSETCPRGALGINADSQIWFCVAT